MDFEVMGLEVSSLEMGMEREENGPGKGRILSIFSPISGINIPSAF